MDFKDAPKVPSTNTSTQDTTVGLYYKDAPGVGQYGKMAPMQQPTESGRLPANYIAQSDLENYMAGQQSGFELFGKAAAQTTSEAILGTIEAGSYLADWEQMWDKLHGDEKQYTNFLAEKMKEAKGAVTDATKVFQTAEDRETGFNPSSATWWAANSPQAIGSTLSLLIPAAGVAGGTAKIASMLGMGAKGVKLTAGISATVASRYAESTMEANGVYEKALSQGATPEAAGEAASKAWNTNWIFALQDFTQYMPLVKGFASLAKGAKGRTIAELLSTPVTEAAEEAGQFIVSEEAVKSATESNVDYFGKGFNRRLQDYLDDPELKSSALLGAMGGTVFAGAGALADAAGTYGEGIGKKVGEGSNWVKSQLGKIVNRGLQKERANYAGDTATSDYIDNITFGQLVADNVSRGTLPRLKADLEELERQPELPVEAKQGLTQRKEDVDFIMNEQAKLKSAGVNERLHQPIMLAKLEAKQLGRLEANLTKDLHKLENEVVQNKELDENVRDIKTLQLNALAYERLAKDNRQYASLALNAVKAFEEALANPLVALALPNVQEALTTTQDVELIEKTFQLLSTQEKAKLIKNDLYKLTTPKGQQEKLKELDVKKAEQAIDTLVNEPTTTKEQLQEALKGNPSPSSLEKINNRLKQITEAKQTENKKTIDKAVQQEASVPSPEESVDFSEEYPGDVPPEDTFDANAEMESQLASWLEPKDVAATVNRMAIETPKQAEVPAQEVIKEQVATIQKVKDTNTIATRLKVIAGSWTVDKDGFNVFEPTLDANGMVIPQFYTDNRTGKRVAVEDVFEVDTKSGRLYSDTPLLKEGDKVILKVENDFPYTLTPGFKPTGEENYVINVYRASTDGKAIGKPITQLPSADSPGENDATALKSLRSSVVNAKDQRLETNVSSKNVGTVRTSLNAHSLEIFTNDYVGEEYKKIPTNPILALAKLNGELVVPNAGAMKGMTPAILEKIEDVKTLTRGTEPSRGSRYVLRTNPLGNLQLVQLQGRKLSPVEIDWVKNNIAEYVTNGDLETLGEVFYVEQGSVGLFKNKPSGRDMTRKSGNQLILIEGTKGSKDLLVPIGNKNWISVNPSNLTALGTNQPFLFRRITADGTWANDVFSSTKLTPEEVQHMVDSYNNTIAKAFRNMREESLNSELPYTDLVTGTQHPHYFDFLVKTETATAKTPGSPTIGHGDDNSYSFYNVGVRLNANINPVSVEQIQDQETDIIIKDEEVIPIHPDPSIYEDPREQGSGEDPIGDYYDTKFRKATSLPGFKVVSQKELDWFTEHIGEDAIDIAKDIDRIISKGGVEAFGLYHNALVRVAQFAEVGTMYHEAFHLLLDPNLGLVTPAQREKVLAGTDEETLAEDFRLYMLSGGNKKSNNIFKRIYEAIKRILGLRTPIENLFSDISSNKLTAQQRADISKIRTGEVKIESEEQTRMLPGFRRYAQQIEATNVSAYQIMTYAWNVAKQTGLPVEEILQTKSDASGKTVLDSSFELLREKYKKDYERIHSITRKNRSQEDTIRHDSYLAMGVVETVENPDSADLAALGKWDNVSTDLQVDTGFKTEVLKAFAQFGFTIQLKDGTRYEQVGDGTGEMALETGELEGEVEEITENITKDEVHGIDITMKDPSKSISQRLKLFLASIPDPEYKSVFGLAVPIEFNKVFTNLSAKLADSPVPMVELANIYKGAPVLTAVYNRIAEEAADGNTTIINEFNTRFNLTETHFVSFVEEYQEGQSVLKMMDTNRNSADRAIVALWKANLAGKGILKRSGEVNVATATVFAGRITAVKNQYNNSKAARNAMPYSQLKTEFIAIIKDMGIVLPEQVWTEMDQSKPSARNTTLANWFFGKQRNSLENLFDNLRDTGLLEGTTVIDVLARRSRNYMDVGGADTFLDEKNNQRYPINLPSALSDMVNAIKSRGEEMYNYYKQDKFYENNKFVDLMKDPVAVSELRVLNPSAYRRGQADPKSFEDRTQADSIITRLGAYSNNSSKSFGIIYVGTHEAKQKQSLIPLKKYNTTSEARTFLTEVLKGTVTSEVVRIQRLREAAKLQRGPDQPKFMDSNPLPTEIKDFSKKGTQFLYMPSLNEIPNLAASLREGDVSHEEFTNALTARDTAIQTFIDDQYQSFLEQLDKLGVISLEVKEGKNIITNELIPESLFNRKQADTFLREFFYNDFAWRHEMSKVFNGDIAFYKSDDDYYKRGYQTVTPGTKPYSDPGNPTTLVTAVYPKMPKVNSFEYLAELAHIVDKNVTAEDIKNHYEGKKPSRKAIVQKLADFHTIENGADSQTLITVDGWKKIMGPLGDWTKKHQKLYDFAWKKGLTVNQAINQTPMTPAEAKQWRSLTIDVATQPIKPFQFSERFITLANGERMLVKEQYKDSRAALNPEFVLRHPGYKALLDYMNANGIEVMVNADAVKVGSYGIIDFSQPVQDWQKRVNSLNDLRLPQLNNNKVKTEASGSQLHKLILGNVDRKGDYNVPGVGSRKGQYVIEEYGEQWSKVHERDSKALKKKLGLTGSTFTLAKDKVERGKQMFKIKTILEQELMSRNLNENYSDAIRLVLDEMNQPRFNVSLAFPNYASRFVGVMTNMFKKTFLNPKSPGFVGVDMAEVVSGQVENEALQFLRNENGEIVEAEIGMPVSFFNKIGLNFKDNVDRKTNKIIWTSLNKVQERALQGILYRIPTSNKSSAIPIRIAMVIPPSQGQVVMVPPEFLTQQGLDFDYDKSQVMLRVLDKEGKIDEESPETKIFDLAWSILTSPQHFEEVMTALTSKNLKAISDQFKAKDNTRWMSPMNPARDVIAEDQNRDAKRMIGIFSRGNTAHAVIQTIKDYIAVGAEFGIDIETTSGYKLNELGNVYDSDGKLISENFGEYQSAALDSGKDPLLYYLSTNKTTSPLVVRMLLSGTSKDLLNNFLNQPILKEWVKELQRTGGTNPENAFGALYENFPGLRTATINFLDGTKKMKLTEDGLSKSLDINPKDNIELSARILAEFQKIINTSRTISKMTNILSVDTFSDMTGPESLEAFINQAVDLVDPENEVYIDPRVFDLDKAPKEAKRLASFFKYAIKDALDLVSEFYPYLNSSYINVKQELAATLGGRSLSNKGTIKALNQFLDFYNMETNGLITPVLDKLAPNPRDRWRYSATDQSMFVYLESMIEKYPVLVKNKFINGLRASYSKPGGVQMIGSANSNTRINKTELTKAWRDLMLNSNKDIKILAYDLVRFSVYTSGFSFNTRSFVDLIPNDFWVENGISDAQYKVLAGLNPQFGEELSSTRLDAEGASRSFIRHNFRTMDEVREVYVKWSDKGIQSQLVNAVVDLDTRHISAFVIPSDSGLRKRGELGNFVKIKTKVKVEGKKLDDYRLYEADPNDYTRFKEVQPAGESRAYFEVQGDGRNVSALPMNKMHGSPDPWNTKEKKQEPPSQDGSEEIPDCSK